MLMQLVAKGILTRYRRQFEDMRASTVARYLAGITEAAMTELNPLATCITRQDHLRDPGFPAGSARPAGGPSADHGRT